MNVDAAAFLQTFFEQASEHVAELEHGMLALERDPHDRETIGNVFRAARSIKGASGTFGLEVMHSTHSLQSVLDLLRQERASYDAELAGLLLQGRDVLKPLLQSAQNGGEPPSEEPAVRAALEALAASRRGAPDVAAPERAAPVPREHPVAIDIRPNPDILSQSMDPLVFLRELAEFASPGRAPKTTLDVRALPALEVLDPELCHLLDGFAVRIADQRFILPLLSVVESFRPNASEVRRVLGRPDLVDVRGSSKPIVHLHRVLGLEGAIADPCQGLVCVLDANGSQLALLVDEVVGQMQVVVKSLEQNHRRMDLLLGATILGDGRVAMILDVQALSKLVHASAAQSRVDRNVRNVPQESATWMS